MPAALSVGPHPKRPDHVRALLKAQAVNSCRLCTGFTNASRGTMRLEADFFHVQWANDDRVNYFKRD
jgi:hypothetical protein